MITLSCGRVALVIGDVMGRGLRAAAAMGQLRTAVRMLAVLDPMPEDLLRHLDDLAQGTDEVQLATCVYAVFDPVTRSLSYATAGHPPPVLQRPDGATELLPAAVGRTAGRRRGAVRVGHARGAGRCAAGALHRRPGRVP